MPRDRTLRRSLQELLGDAGEVYWVAQSDSQRLAAGWYALVDGQEHFLGDRAVIASLSIARIAGGHNA